MTLASPVLWEISRGRRRFRPCSRRIRRRLSESDYFGKCSTLVSCLFLHWIEGIYHHHVRVRWNINFRNASWPQAHETHHNQWISVPSLVTNINSSSNSCSCSVTLFIRVFKIYTDLPKTLTSSQTRFTQFASQHSSSSSQCK
jgi:hypothetical protein